MPKKTTNPRIKEAALELIKRQQARSSFLAYVQYTMADYEAAQHHILICNALDKVVRGELDRLMINMPPRHGKSELASRRLPAYYIGHFPDREVIFATSSADLASKFGEDVLTAVRSPLHKNVFPDFELSAANPKRDDWSTKEGGTYFASGVGGTITGRGGNLIIVDDAIKNMEEAESDASRRKLWDWYTSVLSTRKTNTKLPHGQRAAVVVIQTKWHESDLSGRLVQEMKAGGEQWEILDLPALTTLDGNLPSKADYQHPHNLKALWPERYGVEALILERGQDPVRQRHFSCLYQQNPVPDDGQYFDRRWLQMYDPKDLPKTGLSYYISSDYALSEGRGDYTVHLVVGVDCNGHMWVVDGYKGQTNMLDWIDKLLDCAILYRPVLCIGESGQIRRAAEPFIRKRMRERGVYCKMEYMTRSNKKTVEARSLQAAAAQQKLHLPNTPLGEAVADELVKFPGAKHDDCVDALANLFLAIDKLYGGTIAAAPQATNRRSRRYSGDDDYEDPLTWKTI